MIELYYGFVCNQKGDGKDGVEHLRNAIKYCEEAQMVVMLGLLWTGVGWGYHLMEELDTALEHAEMAFKIQSDGIPLKLSITYWLLCIVHIDLGNLEDARNWGEKCLKLSQDNNEPDTEALSWILLGRILGKVDPSQSGKAEEYILHGIKILDEWNMKAFLSQGYCFLGELYADTGQTEKALETLKKAEDMMKEMGMNYWLRRTQEVLERVEGW